VACRLLNDQFHERLEYWLSKLGPNQFVTFISTGSVACRLLNDQFHERLEYWLSKLGPNRFVTFISTDSVACRLLNDQFHDRLEYWLSKMGPDRFVTLLSNAAIAFDNDSAYERLILIHSHVGDELPTLMRGGCGSYLHCNETFGMLMAWMTRMGKCMFCKTFSRTKVVSRVVKLSNFGLLEELYIQCNQDASKLYSMLFYNHEQGFEQHFPAKRIAVVTSKDKSIPRWLPKNPESSSSPSQLNPSVIDNNGDQSYTGERHPTTNLGHGFGIMSYRDGSVYTGNFEYDKRHGFGKCLYHDGLGVYIGFWANGKRNGLGKMVYSNGEVYTGNFEYDKRHGFGKCLYHDGLGVYIGFWANGKRNGFGKMVYSNGEVYYGEWLADFPYPAS
jgi:hypothetical protein